MVKILNKREKMEIGTMDIKELLEQAKELLQRDKKLVPTLFIETEDGIYIIGLAVDLEKIDKREMMADIGNKFADQKHKDIKCLYFISDAYVSKIQIDGKNLQRNETIMVVKWDIKTNKKEAIVQDYQRSDDDILYKERPIELNYSKIFLLEAFMQSYLENSKIAKRGEN